jgi:hypothetical protein
MKKTCDCHSCGLLHDLDRAIYYFWRYFGDAPEVIALQDAYTKLEKIVRTP